MHAVGYIEAMFEVLVFVYENYWRFDACPEIARGSGIWEEAQLTHAHLNRTTGRGGGKRTL